KNLHRDDDSYTILSACLSNTLSEAESVNGERKAIRGDIEALNAELSTQKEALAHAEHELETSTVDWNASITDFKLEDGTSRNFALNQLEERHAAHATDREISECTEQIESLTQSIDSYTDDLEKFRKRHLPDSPELDPANPDIAENRLAELLASAQVRKTEHETLTRDIEQVKEILRAKEQAREAANVEIR
ncbi:MAG: hypothetical protein GY880_07585, partial [Planctomycetaceae bacterium]|nr:hypothetical protein [Planctomycetaceae bacterium]